MRKHLDLLFDVSTVNKMIAKNPPLTDEEMKAYLDDEGDIVCTVQNFRVDFIRPPSCIFNLEARQIFVNSFLTSYRAGQYIEVSIPDVLLKPQVVSTAFDRHGGSPEAV